MKKTVGTIIDLIVAPVIVYLTQAFVYWEFIWFSEFTRDARLFYLLLSIIIFFFMTSWRHRP